MKNKYGIIILFLVVLFAVFFLSEYILGIWFEDKTPLWKTVAVSIISAAATVWPLIKKGENFEKNKVFKTQKTNWDCPVLPELFFEDLSDFLLQNNFTGLKLKSQNELHFRAKPTFESFGENYILKFEDQKITLRTKPLFFLDVIDNGQAYNNTAKIVKFVNSKV